MIGAGAILLYISIVLVVIPIHEGQKTLASVLCCTTPWFTAIGYSLCYGTILVKMFRTWYIFNNPIAKKKAVCVCVCLCLLLCFMLINTYVIITWKVILGMMHLHLNTMKTRLLVECSAFLMNGVSLPCCDNGEYARKLEITYNITFYTVRFT